MLSPAPGKAKPKPQSCPGFVWQHKGTHLVLSPRLCSWILPCPAAAHSKSAPILWKIQGFSLHVSWYLILNLPRTVRPEKQLPGGRMTGSLTPTSWVIPLQNSRFSHARRGFASCGRESVPLRREMLPHCSASLGWRVDQRHSLLFAMIC